MKMKILNLGIIIMLLMFTITACSTTDEKKLESESKKVSQSVPYQEKRLNLPVDATAIMDMYTTKENELRVAGSSESIGCVWETKDNGDNWERVMSVAAIPALAEINALATDITLSSKEAVVQFFGINGEEETEQNYLVREDGSVQRLSGSENGEDTSKGQDSIWIFYFSSEGDLYGLDEESKQIYRIDRKTGSIAKKVGQIDKQSHNYDFLVTGDILLTLDDKGITAYDKTNGEEKEVHENLKKTFENAGEKGINISGIPQEETFLYQQEQEIYRYDRKTNQSELLLNMKDFAIGEGLRYKVIPQNLEKFMILKLGLPGQMGEIYQYTSGTQARTYEETLTIYTLDENSEMLRMLARYREKNPEVEVILEVGMSEGGVTKTDAIKQLNTRLLAGEGPDILILDGLDIERYIEQEMLVSLTELLHPTTEEDKLFTNILNAYQTKEGVYAVPTRFTVPIVAGEKELIQGAGNLSDLADKFQEEAEKGALAGKSAYPTEMIKVGYFTDVPEWISETGEVRKEKVEDFFTDILSIYEIGGYQEENYKKQLTIESAPMSSNIKAVYKEDARFIFNELKNWTAIEMLYQLRDEKGMPHKILNEEKRKAFIPRQVVGVCSRGSNQKRAKELVSSILSEEIQSFGDMPFEGEGLPVNIKAFDYWLSRHNAYVEKGGYGMTTNGQDTIMIREMTKEDKTEVIQFMEQLNYPITINEAFTQLVIETGEECIKGNITPEEAAYKVSKYYELSNAE